jgi:hypothetical protein
VKTQNTGWRKAIMRTERLLELFGLAVILGGSVCSILFGGILVFAPRAYRAKLGYIGRWSRGRQLLYGWGMIAMATFILLLVLA